LLSADGSDPGVKSSERSPKRNQLAKLAAAIWIDFPKPCAIPRLLFFDRPLRADAADGNSVSLLQTVPKLVRLWKEQARVEREDIDRQSMTADQVDEHASLAPEAGGEGDPRESIHRPTKHLQRRAAFQRPRVVAEFELP